MRPHPEQARPAARRPARWLGLLGAALLLAACETVSQKEIPLAENVIDEANLNQLMLTARDPDDAVRYFREGLDREPDRADLRRGLAYSLVRANRYAEAAEVFQELVTLGQDEPADRVEYAFVNIKLNRWDDVRTLVRTFPSDLETPRRYLVEALLADQDQDWEAADAAYAKAERLSPRPAAVINNWGVSLMARGDLKAAEKLFLRAISYDATLFNAKNNLAIVRGLQGDYTVPVVPLTDDERAIILNNLGIIAMRRGDEKIAKGLFAAAVDTAPRHYAAAAERLALLEAKVEN